MFLFFLFFICLSQKIIYLNTTICSNTTSRCFAQNLDGVYLALNINSSFQNIPYFSLGYFEIIEVLWMLPPFPFRYVGIETYLYQNEKGTEIFGEIANPINLIDLSEKCHQPINLMWGTTIRMFISSNIRLPLLQIRNDTICTIILPIPGEPLTSLKKSDYCSKKNDTLSNVSTFSILIRLTLPENETLLHSYLMNIPSKVKITEIPLTQTNCNITFYPYPSYYNLHSIWTEKKNINVLTNFKELINQVINFLFINYPNLQIHNVEETTPWLQNINYPEDGGFACINTSTNCQGATRDSTYLKSRIHLINKSSHYIVIGCIHYDFIDTSFYSTLSLYRLMNQDNTSGTGILAIRDFEQRSSAIGYHPYTSKWNHGLWNHFYVAQFGYSTLRKLPSSTLFCIFNEKEIPIHSNIFFLSRTYAKKGINPTDFIPEIILEVTV